MDVLLSNSHRAQCSGNLATNLAASGLRYCVAVSARRTALTARLIEPGSRLVARASAPLDKLVTRPIVPVGGGDRGRRRATIGRQQRDRGSRAIADVADVGEVDAVAGGVVEVGDDVVAVAQRM